MICKWQMQELVVGNALKRNKEKTHNQYALFTK